MMRKIWIMGLIAISLMLMASIVMAATGTITIRNPNGRNGLFKVVTVGPNDQCDPTTCIGQDITYVDPQGNSGVVQGGNAIGKIVNAGNSGVLIVIDIQPAP